jgi:hypothetical protein
MKENISKKSRTITDDSDKEANREHFKNLNSFIEQVNINIQNLDIKLSNGVVKKNRPSILEQDCNDIQNIVKQSVDGISDIIKLNSARGINQGSAKNINKKSFEIIEEEQFSTNFKEPKSLIANSKRIKLSEKDTINTKKKLIVNTNLGNKISQKVISSARHKNEDLNKSPQTNAILAKLNKKDIRKLEKKPNTAQQNRNKSANKRYEHEEREVSINKDRSKSPLPMKSYQLKPRKTLQQELLNNSNNGSFLNTGKREDYVSSENKIIKVEIKNIFSNDAKTSRSVLNENPFASSFDKSFIDVPKHPEQSHLENIQNYINLSLLFNEYFNDSIKDFNNKLTSQDMSKLLTSLVENDERNQVTLGFENSAISKIKNGLKNKRDEKKYNSKFLDLTKITFIQRQWRRFISSKLLKINDREKLCNDMKKNTINSLIQNEPFKKIITGMNSLLGQFNSLLKTNKSRFIFIIDISDLVNVYISLSNDTVSETNYNSLLRDIITQNLIKGDESTKASSEDRLNMLNKMNKFHSFLEEMEADKNALPKKQQNNLICPSKLKTSYEKIQRYEYSEEANSKEWDNI